MSAAKAKGPVEFTIDAADFLRGLHNARICAGSDVTLPALYAVQIEGSGEGVTFVATDRYRLGATTIPMKVKAFSFLMRLDDVALLLKLFNTKSGPLAIGVAEDKMTVQPAEGIVAGPQVVVTCTGQDSHFPKWRDLFDVKPTEQKPAYSAGEHVAFNPRYLAAFSRVKSDLPFIDSPMKVRVESALLPVFVDIGDQFRGLLMPVRLADVEARRARVESRGAA